MSRVRLSWMNNANPSETKVIAIGEFVGGDVGQKVMAWAQATILSNLESRPNGWSPLLEEVEEPIPVEKKGRRRLALGS